MSRNKENQISSKRKRFCEEYVVDDNATQAAIRAGYSERTARSQGQRLLTNVDIQKYISELKKEIQERNKITIDECVSLLTSMARFDINDIYNEDGGLKDLKSMPKEARLVIESLDTEEIRVDGMVVGMVKKVKLSNRRSNIIELMKYLGGYKEDNKQKSELNIPVENWISKNTD